MAKGRENMYYPPWVYHINEDVTRRNMRQYEERQRKIEKRCLEIDPDYPKLGLRERHAIRKQAESEVI